MSLPLPRLFLFAIFLSALALSVAAQPTPSTALLVLSKQDHTLAIVDPATLHVVARIPVGEDPHEVVASADGHTAYVSNYGFGRFHTLTAIDLVGQKQKSVIDLGPLRGPHGLHFVADKVWFTAEAAKVDRQLRSGHRQDRLGHGHRPEPHPHDLRVSRLQAHPHHQREFGHGDHSGQDGRPGGYASQARRPGHLRRERQAAPEGRRPGRPAAIGMRP